MKGSTSDQSSPRTTSGSAVSIAAVRLQERISRQIEKDTFCATEPLGELAILAREAKRVAASPEHKVLAFVLETVFRRLHYDQDGRKIGLSEQATRQRLFREPVTQAAACLTGKGGEATTISAALIGAADQALPEAR